ncbi:MAG: hypothetical protein RBR43_00425 [Desulfuromonadaceae bacterium]|jgi:hypothetical protein|nr:hypothetical protein [Desulfuromonas sp.]MDY0184325.1 hypothetical protein [Desulfuromonadaceae bacterium]
MRVEELKQEVMQLSTQEKQEFILSALPTMADEALQDSGFMLRLLPVMLNIVKKSGIDLQQLMQFVALQQASTSED